MVKLDIGEVNQVLDAGAKLSNSKDKLLTTLSYLKSFVGESNLKGAAWTAAKNAATDAYIPLVEGLIAYIDAILAGNSKVKSAVSSFPYGTPLDEALLKATINGYQQSRSSYETTIREIRYEMNANPTMSLYYYSLQNECQHAIETLNAAIAELNKEIQALHQFASSVSGAYNDANSLKGKLESAFKQLGQGGASVYQNGQFTITGMADWASSLRDTYESYKDAAILAKLDTEGMSKDQAATYKEAVTEELAHLTDKGWSEKGLAAYVGYLNDTTKQGIENAIQNSVAIIPYNASNYTLQMTSLILDHIGSLDIVKNDIKDDDAHKTYMQYWANGLPSDFLTQVGDYIPGLHVKTQQVETVTRDEGDLITITTVNGKPNLHYDEVLHPTPSLQDQLVSSAGMLLFVGAQFVPVLNDVVNGAVVGNSAANMIESGKWNASDVATIVTLIGSKGIGSVVSAAAIAKVPDAELVKSELNSIKDDPNENFSINSKGNAVEHIFEGELKTRPNGDIYIQGAHYEPTLNPDIEAQITKTIPDPPLKNEPYKVQIDGKPQDSTMFPKNWTPSQVDEAIQVVYKGGDFVPNGNYIEGNYDGIPIRIDLNGSNRLSKITSAYPDGTKF